MGPTAIIDGMLRREGAYVDASRADRGRPAKFGITLIDPQSVLAEQGTAAS